MRRLTLTILAAAALAAPAPSALAEETGVRRCSERIEVNRPIDFRDGDVFLGRIRFSGLARYADPDEFAAEYDERRKVYAIKSGLAVRANRNVKLSIAPDQRSIAGLSYTMNRRTAEPGKGASVRFQPCPKRTRAFSYDGIVGSATAFSGGFALTQPACLVLEARVRGRDPVRRAISFGMGDTCVQPS